MLLYYLLSWREQHHCARTCCTDSYLNNQLRILFLPYVAGTSSQGSKLQQEHKKRLPFLQGFFFLHPCTQEQNKISLLLDCVVVIVFCTTYWWWDIWMVGACKQHWKRWRKTLDIWGLHLQNPVLSFPLKKDKMQTRFLWWLSKAEGKNFLLTLIVIEYSIAWRIKHWVGSRAHASCHVASPSPVPLLPKIRIMYLDQIPERKHFSDSKRLWSQSHTQRRRRYVSNRDVKDWQRHLEHSFHYTPFCT